MRIGQFMKKSLIVFYSLTSHTAEVASILAAELGIQKTQLGVLEPYGDKVMDLSKLEIEHGSDHPISGLRINPKDYEAIYLGTPTWWKSPVTPIITLIRSGVFKGKDVYPFITTGFDVEGVEDKLDALLVGSNVHKALIVGYKNAYMETKPEDIKAWAKESVK